MTTIAPPPQRQSPGRPGDPLDPDALRAWETVDQPRQLRSVGRREVLEVLGPLVAGIVAGVTICRFFAWGGIMAPTLVSGVLFTLIFGKVVSSSHGKLAATDRIIHGVMIIGALVAVCALASLLIFVVVRGLPGLSLGFFFEDLSTVGPADPGGGALHAIVGTFQQVGVATAVALPIALLTAIYLNEVKGRIAPFVRFLVDAMSGVPSIIAGLFIYAAWVVGVGAGPSGIAASMALIVLMIPTVTRTAEEVLRTIPDGLREASLALGAPQWRAVFEVVLPTARSGLLTASLLGVARIVGETAPPLLTAKGAPSLNANPLEGQQSSLPVFVYQLLNQRSSAEQEQRAFTGMLVLLLIVCVLFTLARLVGGRQTRKR